MKKLLLISLLVITVDVEAQGKTDATNQFAIEGKVKNQLSFSLKDLNAFTPKFIDSIIIYSHLMEPRKTIKNIKGVLLKDIIDKAGIDVSSPKLLSEFYITCIASDNYKVVFSWNEIYNSAIGEHIMIITESNGKTGDQMPDRIALLAAADRATGRRYVKGLQKIVIEQVK
jgi:hypothetical protein